MTTRRLPAEWEPQEELWLALPHLRSEWGSAFDEAKSSVLALANSLASNAEAPNIYLVGGARVAPHRGRTDIEMKYGDIWLRDTAPLFTRRNQQGLEAVCFGFNGWGRKYEMEGDADLAERIAAIKEVPVHKVAMIGEGGAIDGNGSGTFLTTRQCLLNDNRNPTLDEARIEDLLKEALGCESLIWLDEGLLGDHTDGHVDNVARFVGESKVVCMQSVTSHPSGEVMRRIEQTLRSSRCAGGQQLEVVTVPAPSYCRDESGAPLPASYCNFLITNATVVVPVFDCPEDDIALSLFAELFPGRTILPHSARALLEGGGTVHCMSQQVPLLAG